MKERIEFAPVDLQGSGQMVIRRSYTGKDKAFGVTVAYKVGYLPEFTPSKVLLISLADGMATLFPSKEALCNYLNTDGHGFRPMTATEIRDILGKQGNRFPR